jgi:hypothetical protein
VTERARTARERRLRIGDSLGQAGVPDQFSAAVDALQRAHVLSHTSYLKWAPGGGAARAHPVLVAKQLATPAGAISRAADFRRAGTNLAASTLAMLQIEGISNTAVQAQYPRLRRLLPR